MTKDEILELMAKAKEMGVNKVEVDGFKVEFGPTEPTTPVDAAPQVPLTSDDIFKMLPDNDPINDPELAQYYATPYYDELIAQRQDREEHAKIAKNLKDEE